MYWLFTEFQCPRCTVTKIRTGVAGLSFNGASPAQSKFMRCIDFLWYFIVSGVLGLRYGQRWLLISLNSWDVLTIYVVSMSQMYCNQGMDGPQQAPDVCLTSDIGYILVATSYNQFPTSIRRHFLTSFGRLDWTLFWRQTSSSVRRRNQDVI